MILNEKLPRGTSTVGLVKLIALLVLMLLARQIE